jgi:hypothetical protein
LNDEARVCRQISSPQTRGLDCETEEPFQTGALEKLRSLRLHSGQEIKRSANAEHYGTDSIAVFGHPTLLLRASEPYKQDSRA